MKTTASYTAALNHNIKTNAAEFDSELLNKTEKKLIAHTVLSLANCFPNMSDANEESIEAIKAARKIINS